MSASPKPDGRQGLKTPIERAATRDLIGDQVKTAKMPKCSFLGLVEIEAKRFLESGVKLVECPNCASTCSLSLRKGVLRFPSHDQRKTTTPVTSQRWARIDSDWDVVGG